MVRISFVTEVSLLIIFCWLLSLDFNSISNTLEPSRAEELSSFYNFLTLDFWRTCRCVFLKVCDNFCLGGSSPLHPAYCYPNYVQHQHQTPELVYHNQYDPQQQYFDQNQNFAAMRESETWYHQSASTAYQPSSVPIAMKPETEEDQPLDFSVTASTTAEKRPSSSGKEVRKL